MYTMVRIHLPLLFAPLAQRLVRWSYKPVTVVQLYHGVFLYKGNAIFQIVTMVVDIGTLWES